MCGLSPTLSFQSVNDGSLSIDVSVKCSPVPQSRNASRRKRSGNGSRRRRREQRDVKSRKTSTVETSNLFASTESTVLESSMTDGDADIVHVASTEFDVLVHESTSPSPPESKQRQEVYHVPPTFDKSYSDEVLEDNLIDFDTCLPNSKIVNELPSRTDATNCNNRWQQPHQTSSNVRRDNGCISSSKIELMMYDMVNELYRRSVTS